MRRSKKPILIASRKSPLAKVQAQMVGNALARLHPTLEVRYIWVESEGDRITNVPLAAVGGKGLFTKSVERVVLSGDADLAVHSMKDMPADESTPGLQIAAVPMRADARDVLIDANGATTLEDLPQGVSIGTSSPRRAAQLLLVRPDLGIELLRGNVGTRLERVRGAGPDATLLAAAGLRRLGMTDLLGKALSVEQMLPASCQGAIGIQCRRDDHVSLTRCLPLNDATTSTAIHTERAVVSGLGADCHSPIAVLAEPVDPSLTRAVRNADSHWFRLRVRVLSSEGATCLSFDEQCKTRDLRRLTKQAIKDLTEQGARKILQAANGVPIGRQPASKVG